MHYARAPIAEAVIDLHASFASQPDIAGLEAFADTLAADFPQKHRINTILFGVEAGSDGQPVSNVAAPEQLGWRLTSASQQRVLQLRMQGMSFSHLAPYSEWEKFIAEMRSLWDSYANAFPPTAVNRLAVRYINRIALPQGSELDEYLNLTPRLLRGVGETVEGYFMQLVLPQIDLGPGWKAIVNTGLEHAAMPEIMNVLLDIDLFCENQVSAGEEIWDILSKLRDRKNLIFEAAITDSVRSMIK